MLGLDPARTTSSIEQWFALVHSADRERVRAAHLKAAQGAVQSYEWRTLCPGGEERYLWTELRPEMQGAAVLTIQAVCQDVTERRMAEARIRFLAEHDSLTGLSNRSVMRDHLERALAAKPRRPGAGEVAVLYLDLDGFKLVNDRHGHAAGDSVLVQAGRRMRRLLRANDLVARLGGDEFAIVQAAAAQPAASERLAARLLDVLSKPYRTARGLEIRSITASIGIALYPGDANDVEGLLAGADSALYRAKRGGRNRAASYKPEMGREARERRAIEAEVREAVGRGELFVVYQPLAEAVNTETLGYEALLRWQHPTRGLVSPDVFIPIAEANGAILPMGDWVLEEACRAAAAWPEPHFVAVNVSPVQVQRGPVFASKVEDILKRTGLPPGRLELEVTEGVLIREAEAVLEALGRLRALGVRIALDDFGTGYSSLATLKAFPFDKIKVDRRFVAGLGGRSEQDAAIVRAVLGLARGLGLPVVAEGVETPEQLEALQTEGCAQVQGWLIGRPGAGPECRPAALDHAA